MKKIIKNKLRHLTTMLFLFGVIISFIILNGCNSDSVMSDEAVPLYLSSSSVNANIQSRSALQNGSIGIFRSNANNYSALYNINYTYNNGWNSTNKIYLKTEYAVLCAYYPYNLNTSTNPFGVNSTITTLTAQIYDTNKDICYATSGGNTVCKNTPTATFNMIHAYSRFKLTITRSASYSGTCYIGNIELNKNNSTFCTSRTLDISSGSYGNENTSRFIYGLNTTLNSSGSNSTVDFLIPPQVISTSGLTIIITIDSKNYSVNIPVNLFTNASFTQGKMYSANLKIESSSVTINCATFTVQDFGNVENTTTSVQV